MENMNELDALTLQAGAIDGEQAATGPAAMVAQAQEQEQAALADQNTTACRMMLDLAGAAFGVVGFPSVAGVLQEDKKAALAGVWGPVFTKYNVDLSNGMSAYREEIAAVVVTAPIAWAIWSAIKSDAQARADAAQAAGRPAPQAAKREPVPGDIDYREVAPA